MFKTLLKKQLLEFFSGFFANSKKDKVKSKGSKIGFAILFAFLIVMFLFMFFSMALVFSSMLSEEYSWLYFSVFAILATMFGIFGSVFLAYNTLYEAKDNDLLLSLPIKPSVILGARMSGLYISTLAFEAMVLIPSTVVSMIFSEFNPFALIFQLIGLFLLPLLSLAISCILGWIIAIFSSKIRNKGLISVIISVGFLAGYYFITLRTSVVFDYVINHADQLGQWIKGYFPPLYWFSAGCCGDILLFALFCLTVLVVFFAVYKVISFNFIKLSTSVKGIRKKEYKAKNVRRLSAKTAFLKKEFLYFRSLPAYMLNCALGSLLLLIFAGVVVVKGTSLLESVGTIGFSEEQMPLFVTVILCFIASINNITSPSVSLEANNLWLLKSLPLEARDIFFAKIMLHIIVTGVPYTVAAVVCGFACGADVLFVLLSVLTGLAIITLCALTGLMVNLIFPKFDWVNETIPIKQSLSCFLSMFTGLFYCLFLIIPVFLSGASGHYSIYLLVATIVYALMSVALYFLIVKKGTKKFSEF